MGLPPSGKRVTIVGAGVSRVSGGKFVETWDHYDALGLMRQIGVVPLPGPGLVARMVQVLLVECLENTLQSGTVLLLGHAQRLLSL